MAYPGLVLSLIRYTLNFLLQTIHVDNHIREDGFFAIHHWRAAINSRGNVKMKNFIALPSRARVIGLSTTWGGRAGRHAIQPNRGGCGRHSLKTKGRFGEHIIKAALFP